MLVSLWHTKLYKGARVLPVHPHLIPPCLTMQVSMTQHTCFSYKGILILNPQNVLETVKGVGDWCSEGGHYGRTGGLGYWLAVSEQKRREIQQQYGDPDEQKMKLIECWMTHVFASWQWLSRAVGRVGQTQLASLISSYDQPHKRIHYTCMHVV